jgi:hypothetical protein
LLVEDVAVAVVKLSGTVFDLQTIELVDELLIVLDFESVEEEFHVHVAPRVEVLMDLNRNIYQSHQKALEDQESLKVSALLKYLHQKLFRHRRIVLGPSLKLQSLDDIELPAEKHKPING